MYAQHFGLKHEPFSIAPDPRYLFMSERHREALAHLRYGLGAGGGFVLLTGEIGAGKTTVCRCLLEQIPARCNVAYVFNPKLTAIELLRTVCDEFHIAVEPQGPGVATVKDYIDPLNAYLLAAHAADRDSVLIIDEAQNLAPEVLEQLRLLTNLETRERKLLQIILIGQPELRAMLAQPALEQLAQRVIARYHLAALSEVETAQYIRHRLAVAGLVGGLPFDAPAMQRIHALARGVPRRINLLCDRALLGGYASGEAVVGRAIVEQAAREVFDAGEPAAAATKGPDSSGRRAMLALGLGLGMVAGAATYALATREHSPPAAAAVHAAPPVVAAASATPAASATAGTAAASAASAVLAQADSAPAALPASAVSIAAAPAPPAEASAPGGARPLIRDEQEAWRELASTWKVTLGAGDPCELVQREQLQCFRTEASAELIRQLARPGIVTLYGEDERPVYALITAIGTRNATLRVGSISQTVALRTLSRIWRGGFATYWRPPPGYRARAVADDGGPAAQWLAEKLTQFEAQHPATDGASPPVALQARIAAFQRAQGLQADGLAGPVTLMQLNRVTGVDEPRLNPES